MHANSWITVSATTGIMVRLVRVLLVLSIQAPIVLTRAPFSHVITEKVVHATLGTRAPTAVLVLTRAHLATQDTRAQTAARARHALQEPTKTRPAVGRAPTVQQERTKPRPAARRAWRVRPVTPQPLPARGSVSHALKKIPTAWMAYPACATRGTRAYKT